MRTTLDIPEELIEDARKALGFKSKTDTVIVALETLLRRKKIEALAGSAGTLDISLDLDRLRGRPRRK